MLIRGRQFHTIHNVFCFGEVSVAHQVPSGAKPLFNTFSVVVGADALGSSAVVRPNLNVHAFRLYFVKTIAFYVCGDLLVIPECRQPRKHTDYCHTNDEHCRNNNNNNNNDDTKI